MRISEPGPQLSDVALSRADALPVKPAPVVLSGPTVQLEPLELPRDAAQLHPLTDGRPIALPGRAVPEYDPDALVWRYLFGGPFADESQLLDYLAAQGAASDRLTLAVRHRDWDLTVGVFNLAANSPANLRIELGGIALSPAVQGTGVLRECTYLCLAYAFNLGYRRVEWKCDDRNERSTRAALALGFTFEGVQQQHMIVKGRSRDTAWFRFLDSEWPARNPN